MTVRKLSPEHRELISQGLKKFYSDPSKKDVWYDKFLTSQIERLDRMGPQQPDPPEEPLPEFAAAMAATSPEASEATRVRHNRYRELALHVRSIENRMDKYERRVAKLEENQCFCNHHPENVGKTIPITCNGIRNWLRKVLG